jgi:hypothetical protein
MRLKRRSRWREFTFAFRQVTTAILPRFGLQRMITGWESIAQALREPPRSRRLQEETF